jgi:hypothetical protein
MGELLLAQALDACIRAERRMPGSAAAIIAQQPEWAQDELNRLVDLASSLDKAATNAVISEEFRAAARARLMQRIGAEPAAAPMLLGPHLTAVPSRTGHRGVSPGHRSAWLWRGSAGLLACILAVAATLTASASALPGEPLYGLKQAQEEMGVRLAVDDQARALALFRRADARLDETARLLQLGRTDEALVTTQRYDQVVERATTAYVVTIDDTPEASPAAAHIDTRLSQQQDQLQTMLQTAPELARGDLREALVATKRSRALVADPRPVERALGRNGGDAVAAAVPTTAAEDLPTVVPTRDPTLLPTPPVLAEQQHAPLVAQAEPAERGGRDGADDKAGGGAARGGAGTNGAANGAGMNPRPQVATVASNNGRGASGGAAQPVTSGRGDERADDERNAEQAPAAPPAVMARDDRGPELAAPQNNTSAPRAQNDGRASGVGPQAQPNERPREEDAPAPALARPQTVPAHPADARNSSTSGAGPAPKQNDVGGGGGGGGGGAARPLAPPTAVALAQTERSGRDTGEDVRPPPATTPGSATRAQQQQPTPTPTTLRKNSSDDKSTPTPATHNAGSDKNNGGNGGADHPGPGH